MSPAKTWGWHVMVDGHEVGLGELGDTAVRSVSQIELAGTAFRDCAQGLHDAAQGFMANARRSEQAPIDDDVLTRLRGVLSGAEEAARAAQGFLTAFEEHYRSDIRTAQTGRRMDNPALTG